MRYSTGVLLVGLLAGPLHATEYSVPPGDVSRFFRELPADATSVVFSGAAEYTAAGDIELPARPLLVIDGRGCTLRLGPESRGFTCAVADQHAAMERVSSRYVIRDLGAIEGGRTAISLAATLGSRISNVKCVRQTEAAVDLRFCLLTRLEQVFVTNPVAAGFVLRQGDWPGATAFNSQCNSSVLDQCRVNCSKTTTDAFRILNSGGVELRACVSEGAPCAHDLFLSARTDGNEAEPADNTVVKAFLARDLHIEHAARTASIHVNMPAKAAVTLSNVYWNGPQTAPVIRYTLGQLNLEDIGWWHESFRIVTRISAPRINVQRCHSGLDVGDPKAVRGNKAGVLELRDAVPGNEQLKLTYVRVRERSM
jgi:hypothetical protein